MIPQSKGLLPTIRFKQVNAKFVLYEFVSRPSVVAAIAIYIYSGRIVVTGGASRGLHYLAAHLGCDAARPLIKQLARP